MEYVETQFQTASIFNKALDAVTFVKFREMLVVSESTLSLMAKKSKKSEEKKSDESAEMRQTK